MTAPRLGAGLVLDPAPLNSLLRGPLVRVFVHQRWIKVLSLHKDTDPDPAAAPLTQDQQQEQEACRNQSDNDNGGKLPAVERSDHSRSVSFITPLPTAAIAPTTTAVTFNSPV